ncbi:MAG TPA: hypothetical protein DCE41_17310, partial [Cytophagales bacterium]|nr:hypothetical protein [Cytophagales bacterium]
MQGRLSEEGVYESERDRYLTALLYGADRGWISDEALWARWPTAWPLVERKAKQLALSEDVSGLLALLDTYQEDFFSTRRSWLLSQIEPLLTEDTTLSIRRQFAWEQLLDDPSYAIYQAYKGLYTASEWAAHRETFLDQLQGQGYRVDHILRRIYQDEETWPRLWQHCQEDIS